MALTLSEVGVSEDDAAQIIYDLRREVLKLRAALYAIASETPETGIESIARKALEF